MRHFCWRSVKAMPVIIPVGRAIYDFGFLIADLAAGWFMSWSDGVSPRSTQMKWSG
jgi:hypothetical protein